MMKKRMIAWTLTALFLVMAVPAPVYAAEGFPLDEFNFEKENLKVSHAYDADTDISEESLMEQGLLLDSHIEFQGLVEPHGRSMYNQLMRVKIWLPGGFFSLPGEDQRSTGPTYSDSDSAFDQFSYDKGYHNQHAFNDVSTSLVQYAYHTEVFSAKDVQAAMQEDIALNKESIPSLSRTAPNESADPSKVVALDNGYLVKTENYHKIRYDHEDGTFQEILEYKAKYWVYYTNPAIPGIYFRTHYTRTMDLDLTVEWPEGTEYTDIYNHGLELFEESKSNSFENTVRATYSDLQYEWLEPETTWEYTGSKENPKEDESAQETQKEPEDVHVEVTQHADTASGEETGVSVPKTIVIGVGAAAAAAAAGAVAAGAAAGAAGAAGAAAGAAGAGADPASDPEAEKRRKTYKMYTQKDFGDAIPRGGEPVSVRARMAEADPSGAEADRPDLTARITVSAAGMTIHSVSLVGRYMEARVSIPADYAENQATITFTFNGEGGTFTNNVVFRATDGANIAFAKETEPGSGQYVVDDEYCEFTAIRGDGQTYVKEFLVRDAVAEPDIAEMSVLNCRSFGVRFEATDRAFVYRMHIQNNTPVPQKTDVFEELAQERFDILVKIPGQEKPAIGHVYVDLSKEGLTVRTDRKQTKNDITYARATAYERSDAGDLDSKWIATDLLFNLVIREDDQILSNPEGVTYKVGKLKGAGGMGTRADYEESLASKFVYDGKLDRFNGRWQYRFIPQTSLADPEDGSFYMVLLPVSCTYKDKEYAADIPIRLEGVVPDPYQGWEEEFQKLMERIDKFSLPEDKSKWLAKVDKLANDPRSSTAQLRLTSKMIVRNYMQYWTIESVQYRNEGEIYDCIITQLGWIKFVGDCAFSYVVGVYAGPTAEAVISPAKDYLVEALGECFAAWNYGTDVDLKNLSIVTTIANAGDNLVANTIDVTNWRQSASTLGIYFVYASIKNFVLTWKDKGECDLYGSILKGFSDMTLQGFKAAAGKLLEGWLKDSKKVQEWLAKNFSLQNQTIKNLQYDLNDSLRLEGKLRELAGFQGESDKVAVEVADIILKYLGDLVGVGAATVEEHLEGEVMTFSMDSRGHFIMKDTFTVEAFGLSFDYSIDLTMLCTNIASPGFGYLYDTLFGAVPFAKSLMSAPAEPILPDNLPGNYAGVVAEA